MDDEVASQNLVNIRVTDDEGEQDAVLELHLNSEAMQMYAMRWNVITAILSGCWNMMPKVIWLLRNIPGEIYRNDANNLSEWRYSENFYTHKGRRHQWGRTS